MLRVGDQGIELDLDAIPLTDAQRQALAIDRHVVVSAGAGSGKTHTLAWRFVRLLLTHARNGGDDVEAVVVLTFTEKAAEEMTTRCYTRLLAVTRAVRALDTDLAARLERMVDRFDQSRIGTFHGFCARILREFPAAAGLPGDLEILEGTEGDGLRRASADDAVLHWAREMPARLGELLDAFGSRRSLVDAVAGALAQHAALEERLEAHRAGRVHLDLAAIQEQTQAAQHWLKTRGLPMLVAIERLVRPGGSAFAKALGSAPVAATEPLAIHRQLQEVLGTLLNDRGELRTLSHHSVIGSKASWNEPRRYHQAKAALTMLAERCADWPERLVSARVLPTSADARLLQVLPTFARLVQQAHRAHWSQLRSQRALDFDTLQSAAVRAVLDDAGLRSTLRQRHRWFMVDEFQDTDSRQWAMVRALGDALPGEAADRIFLVGDVKQAVYGFRGGEVHLFAEAAQHLGVQPLSLPDNFRTLPALIDWFNHMFPRVLPEAWVPMLAARPAAEGRVTWIDAKGAAEQSEAAARWIVTTLLALPPIEGPSIAILLRTRTHLGTWEASLRRHGIAYRIGQGVGFWERQEIQDVVNVLHAAITGNPLSKVGALRVPWLGATDAEVNDHVLHQRPHPALEQLKALAEVRRDLSIIAWVRRLLEGFEAWSWWDPAARANVELLLDTISAWDHQGVPLLEIGQRLLDRVVQVPRETEAALHADRARVIVLTVHAAKGLEFPVVVLPELERSPSGRSPALAVGRVAGQLEMAFRVDDLDAPVQTHTRPALLNQILSERRELDHAEYRRLLYVAVTRARDQLVLIGPSSAPERSWAGLLADPPSNTVHCTAGDLCSPTPTLASESLRWEVSRRTKLALTSHPELTASDLVAFEACAARWFRTRRLAQPEPGVLTRPREIAGLRGSVLHGLLEDRVYESASVASARWDQVATGAGLTNQERRSGFKVLDRHRSTLASSPEVADILAAPGFDELAVRTPFDRGVFIGRLDRLYLDRERGGFVVLDYKTENLRSTSPALAAARHSTQLLAYAWAANEVLERRSQPGVVGAQVLFSDGAHAMPLGPWGPDDYASIPGRLASIAGVRSLDSAMHRAQSQAPECGPCPFLGSGCPGVGSKQPSLFSP